MRIDSALAGLVTSFVLVACAADGKLEARASSDEANVNASAFSEGEASSTKTTASAPAEGNANATPVQATGEAPKACPLQCFVAQRGRVTPADEQRLTTELAEPLNALRQCGAGNSLTIRFDSGGQLTEFGVDAERGNEGSCVQSVRQQKPTLSFPGPSTLRCYERCAGDPVRSARGRGTRLRR